MKLFPFFFLKNNIDKWSNCHFIACVLLQLFIIAPFSKKSFGQSEIKHQTILLKSALNDSVIDFTGSNVDSFFSSFQQYHFSNGYLSYSIDDSMSRQDSVIYTFHRGDQYYWKDVVIDTSIQNLLEVINLDFPFKENEIVDLLALDRFNQKILAYQETQGRIFSQVLLLQPTFSNNYKLSAKMIMRHSEQLLLDTIHIYSDFNISKKFLMAHLNLKEKSPLNPTQLKFIPKNIGKLSFATMAKPYEVHYKIDKTELNIYLKERKVNTINAIIGIQPAPQFGKYFITADAIASLRNYLGYGESIDFNYQQIQGATRRLLVKTELPYILGSRFGISAGMKYFQQDSTFRRVEGDAGIVYFLNSNFSFNLQALISSHRLLHVDTQSIVLQKRLPANIDVKTIGSNLVLSLNTLDNVILPRSGWDIVLNAAAINRTFITNNTITEINDGTGFDYNTLYDSLLNSSVQYKIQSHIAFHKIVYKSIGVYSNLNFAYLSPIHLFKNEMYQIGGFKLLRGFNELSIFTQQYYILTVEPRIYLNESSYFAAFADVGYIWQQNINKNFSKNFVLSSGVSGSFSTNAGIFNAAIGIGKMDAESMKFKNARVHFGYAIRF